MTEFEAAPTAFQQAGLAARQAGLEMSRPADHRDQQHQETMRALEALILRTAPPTP